MTINEQPAAPLPLKGIKVLDLTAVLMGPYASQILGDLGADVIKVESFQGDTTRLIGPARHAGMGGLYINTNRSKRSIVIDLKNDAGKQVLMRLVRGADVFLYNVRPQAITRLGLSYEALCAINPRLVYVGVFGYGQDGPYAAKPAYDDLIQGASSLSGLFSRSTGAAPQYAPIAMADRIAALFAVNAVLAAIIERSASGKGQRIDVPMFETMVSFVLSDHLSGMAFDPPLSEAGYSRLLARSRRPYRTSDGYLCAMIYNDKQWRAFLRMLGREPEMETDSRLQSLATRTIYIDALYAEIESILATRATAEWLATFEQIDIPAMAMHDLDSIFDDEHLNAIGFFGREEHPTEGSVLRMRNPVTWSRTQPGPIRPAPRHGEHTEQILREAGYGEAEILELARARAVLTEIAASSSREPTQPAGEKLA